MTAVIGLRQPWQWVQPLDDAALVARLIEARDYAVHERERENLCSVAAARIGALRAENERLRGALHKIGYEPIGAPEATHSQVLDGCIEIARDALAKVKP